MFQSALFPLIAIIGFTVGAIFFFKSIANFEAGFSLFILTILFGGIVGVNLGSSAAMIGFRDLFVVIPLYIAVFGSSAGKRALSKIPLDVAAALLFLFSVIAVCMLNISNGLILQALIGLKVWLFYVPFLGIGLYIADQPELRLRIMRRLLFWGFIPCAIGLAQSLLVRVFNYATVIGWFYGSHASEVTQGFTVFDVAGGIYRIPATFSFAAQYASFLYMYITVVIIVNNSDPEPWIRNFARAALMMTLIAAIFCGSRASILLFPILLTGYAVCGLLGRGVVLFAPLGVAAGIAALSFSGLSLLDYFAFSNELRTYDGTDFASAQLATGLEHGILGEGLGTATNAARFVSNNNFDEASYLGLESYYAKASFELGYIGFSAIVLVFLIASIQSLLKLAMKWNKPEKVFIAPLAIYIIYSIVMSAKGTVLDTDPGNIFFWLFLGLLIGIARAGNVQAIDKTARLKENSGIYEGDLLPAGE